MYQFTRTVGSALLTAAILVIAPVAASASPISFSITLPTTPTGIGCCATVPAFLTPFDPTKGTLTSVVISFTAPALINVTDPDNEGGNVGAFFMNASGETGLSTETTKYMVGTNQAVNLSATITSAADLLQWSGPSPFVDISWSEIDFNNDSLFAGVAGKNIINGTVVYNFTSPTTTTPLPATLPLFASGLGALGLLHWRRKRKAQAVA